MDADAPWGASGRLGRSCGRECIFGGQRPTRCHGIGRVSALVFGPSQLWLDNESDGTDHGRGGVAIALGDGLQTVPARVGGGVRAKIVADFPVNPSGPGFMPIGLSMVEPDDLPVMIDYRDIEGEFLIKRMSIGGKLSPALLDVFPALTNDPNGNYTYTNRKVFKVG